MIEKAIADAQKPVDTWRGIETPLQLWHYTSLIGFQGIIRDSCIFATDFHFLNDIEEIRHAQNFAKSHLTALVDAQPKEEQELHRKAIEDTTQTFEGLAYVASFTTLEDTLSQWRGYSNGSVGVSLGFDLRNLRKGVPGFTLNRCIYTKLAKQALMLNALDPYLSMLSIEAQSLKRINISTTISSPGNLPDRGAAYRAHGRQFKPMLMSTQVESRHKLTEIAPFLKDEAFSEESEWRICVRHPQEPDFPIKFRVRPDAIVPYVPVDLRSESRVLPLTEVILGPGSSPNARSSLTLFLKSHGIEIEPRISKIPFQAIRF